jgi:putative lipoprotein (rSAM/lipoprotein system)
MKKVRNLLLRTFNRILGFLLLMLGFTVACNEVACEYGTPVAEYGAPFATFIVQGKVVNTFTEQAIPSIRVVMMFDTSFTDQNGNYQAECRTYPNTDSFPIEFADVDGTQNGLCETLDTLAIFTDPQFTGGDGDWDIGETEKELQIRMRPLD